MRKALFLTAALSGVAALQGCALVDKINTARAYNYLAISHASAHIDASRDFQEVNPGIGFGSEAPLKNTEKVAVGIETGRFLNSLDDLSSYSVGYWEYDLLPSQPRRVRVGGFLGLAEYPTEAGRDNLPSFGDFIMVGGLQATVATVGNHELRMRAAPGITQSGAILTLQSNFKF